jgi:hypothetical protein
MYIVIKMIDFIDYLTELAYYLTHEYLVHPRISVVLFYVSLSTMILYCIAKSAEGKHARCYKQKTQSRKGVSGFCGGLLGGMFFPTFLYAVAAICAVAGFVMYLLYYVFYFRPSEVYLCKLAGTTPRIFLAPLLEMLQTAKGVTRGAFVFQVNWIVLWPPLFAGLWILKSLKQYFSSKIRNGPLKS